MTPIRWRIRLISIWGLFQGIGWRNKGKGIGKVKMRRIVGGRMSLKGQKNNIFVPTVDY